MIVKKHELLQLWKLFEVWGSGKLKIKFSYFIAKNKSKIKDEVEILNKLAMPPEKFQLYDQRRAALAQEFSDKDENGNPVIRNQNYVITERREEFEKVINHLREENKEVISEVEKQRLDYEEILKQDFEFNGHKIKLEDLPDEIEPQVIELLMRTDLLAE